MTKSESNLEVFTQLLRMLPEPLQEDVYEFVSELFANSTTNSGIDMSPEARDRIGKELMKAVAENTGQDHKEPEPPSPREKRELAATFFDGLSPEEQRLSIFYTLMKLQDVYRPILGNILLAKNEFSDSMQAKFEKIHHAVELAYPMIESRLMPGRNVLPDLHALAGHDQEAVMRAERRLAWMVAYNYTASSQVDEHVTLMQESARKDLAKLYAKMKLPAADILSKSVQQGFITTYQRAGLARRYLS